MLSLVKEFTVSTEVLTDTAYGEVFKSVEGAS